MEGKVLEKGTHFTNIKKVTVRYLKTVTEKYEKEETE